MSLTPKSLFSRWEQFVEADPDRWAAVDAVYLWRVSGDGGGAWCIRCKAGPSIKSAIGNTCPDVTCEIETSSDDLVSLVTGQLNPQTAFLSGRLKVAGDLTAALKLGGVISEFALDAALLGSANT